MGRTGVNTEEKLLKRRLVNREYARQSRKKQKAEMERLRGYIAATAKDFSALREALHKEQEKNVALNAQLDEARKEILLLKEDQHLPEPSHWIEWDQ
jgi:hypothetical protein